MPNIATIHPGSILISDPFLQDPNFARTVVLICEHQPAGSFGLVVNQPLDLKLNELVPAAADMHMPVYSGGPVAADTLHFIHKRPDLLEESIFLQKGIGWSGNFFQIIHTCSDQAISIPLKFFFSLVTVAGAKVNWNTN
jgi:putative transcriptional regulator